VTDKTERQTRDYGIYHASMASCGKNRGKLANPGSTLKTTTN